jgi:hypothetical protein
MTPLPEADAAQAGSRRLVYGLLITLAAGLAAGRIASAERVYEPSVHRAAGENVPRPAWPATRPEPWPTFSSNDRSRWAAVRALVDQGTWVIGRRDRTVVLASGPAVLAARDPLSAFILLEAGYQARTRSDSGIIFEDGFQSVDKMLNPRTLEYYSTKPPLLTVLVAGEYWLLKKAFGWSLVEQRWEVIRTVVVTFNLVPLVLYLAILAWLAERLGTSDWSRYFIVAAGGFATLVTPFLITLNNHTLAATGAAVALYAMVRIVENPGAGWLFALAGLSAGFTACMELPAAALAAGLGVYLVWKHPGKTLALYVPAVLLLVAAWLVVNCIELGEWVPAYSKVNTPWYQYEGSHWRVPPGTVKRGIDFARRNGETRAVYALHLLVGHHGLISLMPIMLLAVAGMAMGVWRLLSVGQAASLSSGQGQAGSLSHATERASQPLAATREHLMGLVALCSLLLGVVVIGFYLYTDSRNYGGWSNGPRWLMWLTPWWLACMLPALDGLARRRAGRALALVLLALSILAMSYQSWNPWRHPYLYNWMESRGWVRY